MATIDLILRAVNKATGPLQDIAARAQEAADKIDSLNDKVDKLNDAMAGADASARLAESGMKAAGREADILAGKLSILNGRLDELDRTVTAKVKVDVDRSALSRLGTLLGGGGRGGGLGGLFGGGASAAGGAVRGAGALYSALPPQAQAGVAIGAAAAAYSGAAFIAQQAASGLIFGLGSALAGLGIAGALKSQLPASITNAQTNYQGASANLNTAISTSPADLKAYQGVLKGLEPDLARAAVLLANQNVVWQNLTPAQQNSETALRNNSAAYKTLLPDQQKALNALLQQRDAWNALSPAQQQAANATAGMQNSLSNLTSTASDALTKIGAPFVGVLGTIFDTAAGLVGKMTPTFVSAEKVISGPFQVFGTTLVNSFGSPQVKNSIQAVAGAFGKLLTALAPGLPGDVNEIATGITKIANAVAANPQAFATFINDLFKLAQVGLSVIADLTRVATYIEAHFRPALHDTAVDFDGVRHEVAHIADDMASSLIRTYEALYNDIIGSTIRFGHNVETQYNSVTHESAVIFDGSRGELGRIYNGFWNDTLGAAIRFGHNVETQYNSFTHESAVIFDGMRGELGRIYNGFWNDTLGATIRFGHNVETQFDSLRHTTATIFDGIRHDIADIFSGAAGWLFNAGKSVVQGLVNGILSAPGAIVSAIESLIPGPLRGVVASALHLIGFASGTGYAPPGWAWVGERGPELMRFRGGERVLSAPVSAALSASPAAFASSSLVADSGTILSPGWNMRYNGTGGPEPLVPAGAGGPLIHIGEMHVHDESDATLVAQRLSGMIRAASLGGGFRR